MPDINSLSQSAIKAALDGLWQQAVDFNLDILEAEPNNLAALLRVAKAYTNLNKINQDKKYYHKVLLLDKYNPIAKRNLSRLPKIKNFHLPRIIKMPIHVFLEEPGKTKSVSLVRLTDEKNLAALEIGEPIDLVVHPKSISVNKNGRYLGRLPEDLAFRLAHLIRRGNQYEAFIRSISPDRLQIFIKEIQRSKRNQQIPSFTTLKMDRYQAFLPADVLYEEPLVMNDNETEED